MKEAERIGQLIEKGEAVLRTHRPNPPNVIGFPTLEAGAYAGWRSQSISLLSSMLGTEHTYVQEFKSRAGSKAYTGAAKAGIGILRAVLEDLNSRALGRVKSVDPIPLIEQICNRFHLIARQLRSRHHDRETLNVQDEYDVQDLFHALLLLHFEDIRPEEYTPSYAGKSSRMDFLLKRESIVIEMKKTRAGLGPKELSTQLIEDIERYKAHQGCVTLICFVYDPDGFIPNPRGIEADLARDGDPLFVKVLIRPY